tara:strand:+ start:2072 stop:2527 length:456 start_codon:yes stop_codon:yes gene_type:complete
MKIKGFEHYCIFEDGKVINKHGKEMKYEINNRGYKRIRLHKNNIKKKYFLHRLLALHFIENTRIGIATTVDHIDRDKLNNNLSNLRWATHEEQRANRYIIPITKGGISNGKKYYIYQWREDKIPMSRCFTTLQQAKLFQIEHLETYNLQFI